MRPVFSFLPALALVLAVAGCGDDTSDTDADESSSSSSAAETPSDTGGTTSEPTEEAPTTDAGGELGGGCDYLSEDDVAAATGIAVSGVDSSGSAGANCSWTDESGSSVNLSITDDEGAGTFDFTVQGAEAAISPSEDLPGVGDRAVILYGDAILPQGAVVTLVGDKIALLIYTSVVAEEADVRSAVTELATKVAANL